MAKNDPEQPDKTAAEEWETVNTGSLGEEWDFERDGDLVGNFLGTRTVETQKVESGEATALLFAPRADPESTVFVWSSADLAAFTETINPIIRVGDLVKLHFLGRRQFTGQDGKPRQIKQYRVQMPRVQMPKV